MDVIVFALFHPFNNSHHDMLHVDITHLACKGKDKCHNAIIIRMLENIRLYQERNKNSQKVKNIYVLLSLLQGHFLNLSSFKLKRR